jgi:hypothetical protein
MEDVVPPDETILGSVGSAHMAVSARELKVQPDWIVAATRKAVLLPHHPPTFRSSLTADPELSLS